MTFNLSITIMKKVSFGSVQTQHMIMWSFAYKESRKDVWGRAALDRWRFQRRIEETEQLVKHVLQHKIDCLQKSQNVERVISV